MINLTSDLYRSTWGDENLFFQHHLIQRDFNIMNNIGDTSRRRNWKNALEIHEADDTSDGIFGWGDRDVVTLGDDAQAIIQEGIKNFGCPFAWLMQ